MTMRPLILAALCSWLIACAPTEPLTRPQITTAQAERLEREGDHEQAAGVWQELARDRPERAAEFLLAAAEAWLAAGEPARAHDILAEIDPAGLAPSDRFRMDLVRAELALLEGDFATAGALLAVPAEEVPPQFAERFAQLNQRLIDRREAPAAAAIANLNRALETGRFTPELALSSLIELPLAELEKLTAEHGRMPALAPWLDLAATARRHLLDDHQLHPVLNEWEKRHPDSGYSAPEALEWLQAFRATVEWPERIAVLLPGSGGLVRPGEALREGIMVRWLELPPDRRPELRFYDLDDHPDAAVGAWFQAREDGADFLIGPLDRSQVEGLLGLPDPGMPMLLLNRPENAAGRRAGAAGLTAVLALPPEEEAELAAVHALVHGHRRALVLAQSTGWGHRVAEHFAQTFTLGGGRIVGQAEYRAEESDHTDMLETLLELDRSRQRIDNLARTLGTGIESRPRRRSDVDLVFLAARAADARQLRPQLEFFDAGDLPIYATSHVYSVTGADPDLDGIQLPAAPWLMETTAEGRARRQAEQLFESLSNPTLSRLHALGRDAMALVPWLSWMQNDPQLYLPGHTGRLRLADGQMLERDLPWARIERGQLVSD